MNKLAFQREPVRSRIAFDPRSNSGRATDHSVCFTIRFRSGIKIFLMAAQGNFTEGLFLSCGSIKFAIRINETFHPESGPSLSNQVVAAEGGPLSTKQHRRINSYIQLCPVAK
jgi:hypothetical protein